MISCNGKARFRRSGRTFSRVSDYPSKSSGETERMRRKAHLDYHGSIAPKKRSRVRFVTCFTNASEEFTGPDGGPVTGFLVYKISPPAPAKK